MTRGLVDGMLLDFDGIVEQESENLNSEVYGRVVKWAGGIPKLNHFGLVHIPGVSAYTNLDILKRRLGLKTSLNMLVDQFNCEYARLNNRLIAPPPDEELLGLLNLCDQNSIGLGIASLNYRWRIEQSLIQRAIRQYFSYIGSGELATSARKAKAKREILIEGQRHLARRCALVGDTPVDSVEGNAIRMPVIIVMKSYTILREYLGRGKPTRFVRNMREIDLPLIRGL